MEGGGREGGIKEDGADKHQNDFFFSRTRKRGSESQRNIYIFKKVFPKRCGGKSGMVLEWRGFINRVDRNRGLSLLDATLIMHVCIKRN